MFQEVGDLELFGVCKRLIIGLIFINTYGGGPELKSSKVYDTSMA